MAEKTYTVIGMTCAHCSASVRSEVSQVSGVDGVEVDLGSGRLTVTGDAFTAEQIREAVVEAGYTVIDA